MAFLCFSQLLHTVVLVAHALVPRRRQWHPTPVLLPGKSHGRRSLEGCSPWGCWGSDTTERLHFHFSLSCIGEGNGSPLQCSCLENPRDGGAWWTAVYRVAQSRTGLKWLSSSSSSSSEVQETPLLSTTMQLVVKQRFPTSHKKDCSFSLPSFLKNPPLLLITSFLETNFLSIIYVIYFPVSAGLTQSRKRQQEIHFLMWLAMPRVKLGLILNMIRVQNNLPEIFWGSVLLSLSIWQQRTTDILGFISAYHIHDREEERKSDHVSLRVTFTELIWYSVVLDWLAKSGYMLHLWKKAKLSCKMWIHKE